jgi:subtilase family serine protease
MGKIMIRRFRTSLLAIVAVMSLLTIANAEPQRAMTRHTRDVVVNKTVAQLGHLPTSQRMRLTIALPLRDQAGLEAFLSEVYDSNSPLFRHFLTVDEFTSRFGPTQADYDTLIQFAEENGLKVEETSRNRVNLDVTGTVDSIEKAFHVSMGLYQHPTEARTFFAPDREPTADLPFQLWHIEGLDNFSTPHHMLMPRSASSQTVHTNATPGSCPGPSYCGSDMRAAYYGATTLTGAGQSVGIFELLGTDLTDLTDYFTNAGQTNNVVVTLQSVGGNSTSCTWAKGECDDTEQTLDMTQAISMAPGMSSLVMYCGGESPVDDAAIFNAMATANPLQAQLSSSWAWLPADPTSDNPYFLEFAAQGQNLFSASGDSGSWQTAEFVWPSDSVYLTSVGGTDLTTTGAGGAWSSETAWADGGGGYSPNKFAIPSWQTSAAAGCSSCSKTYRNGPDVSANANFTFYVCSDQGHNPYFGGKECAGNVFGGTSFAAPMWAGFMALANEQALLNGATSTLGFINPTLYSIYGGSSYHTDFHDITSGCQTGGYCAATGYDLVTGIGTPNGPALINALAGTTSGSFSLAASPKAIKIAQGKKAVVKITSTITGSFDSAVTIKATGMPSGVTVAYKNNPIPAPGSGTAQIQLTVSSTATTGIATITVTGTGGGATETTTFKLDVVK